MASAGGHWNKGRFTAARGKAKLIPSNAFKPGETVTHGARAASIWSASAAGGWSVHGGAAGSGTQTVINAASTWRGAVDAARSYLLGK